MKGIELRSEWLIARDCVRCVSVSRGDISNTGEQCCVSLLASAVWP